jgi:hypothetical protein
MTARPQLFCHVLRLARSAAIASLAAIPVIPANPAAAQLWDARDRFLAADLAEPDSLEFGHAVASCDWNGDGRSDLAVGAPELDDNGGGLYFYLMSPSGAPVPAGTFGSMGSQLLGKALACGDFDGDGDDELAAGAPWYELAGVREGRVMLFEWNGSTLAYIGSLRQSLDGVAGAPEDGDLFGESLAVGDFDADGADDLAVGSPGEDVGTILSAGAVTLFYGQAGEGLVIAGNSIWHKDTAGVPGEPGAGEELGEALAAFDSNCDAYDDLAVGVPGQTIAGVDFSGAVYILTGSAEGIVDATSFVLDTTSFPQAGASPPHTFDRFGETLASAGNYFSASCGALAIGAPTREVDGLESAGALYLLGGSVAISRYYTVADFGGTPDPVDRFADFLAFADFDADGRTDLAVGIPNAVLPIPDHAGGVYIALSAGAEPDPANATFIYPRSTLELFNIVTQAQDFGAALAAADFDGNGSADLAISLPGSSYDPLLGMGGVELLFSALFSADFEGGNRNEWSSSLP